MKLKYCFFTTMPANSMFYNEIDSEHKSDNCMGNSAMFPMGRNFYAVQDCLPNDQFSKLLEYLYATESFHMNLIWYSKNYAQITSQKLIITIFK